MARPTHTLVEYSGSFGGISSPIDVWSVGLRCVGDVMDDNLATVAAAAETAWGNAIAPVQAPYVHLARTRVAVIAGAGDPEPAGRIQRRADGSYALHDEMGDTPGTNAAGVGMPTQISVVASLGTTRAGATGKGRIFLPWTGHNLQSDLRLSVADAQSIANAVQLLVTNLNAIALLGTVSVVSSKGYATPVTSVRVGRVIDTQRSRRNARDESYVTAA